MSSKNLVIEFRRIVTATSVWFVLKYFHIYRDLSYGRGNTAPIKEQKLPSIVKTEAWDGKDGELPPEEDIDLSDVDLDEKDEL